MEFRKVLFGGYDKKEVQMAIDKLIKQYDVKIEEMNKTFEAKVGAMNKEFDEKLAAMQADFEKKQKASEFLMIDLNKNISELTEENEALVIKQGKIKAAYKEYCENTLQQYANSLRALSNEFSHVLENVVNLQKEIGSKDIVEEMDRALEMKQMYDALEEVEKED